MSKRSSIFMMMALAASLNPNSSSFRGQEKTAKPKKKKNKARTRKAAKENAKRDE